MSIFSPAATLPETFSSILRGSDGVVRSHVLQIASSWDFVWRGVRGSEDTQVVQDRLDAIHSVMQRNSKTCFDAFVSHANAVAFCLTEQPGSVPAKYRAMPPGWSIEWQQDGSGKANYTQPQQE